MLQPTCFFLLDSNTDFLWLFWESEKFQIRLLCLPVAKHQLLSAVLRHVLLVFPVFMHYGFLLFLTSEHLKEVSQESLDKLGKFDRRGGSRGRSEIKTAIPVLNVVI